MDFEKYGTRLYGYSLHRNSKGLKLKRLINDKEYTIGYVASETVETHGPVTITIWTLNNGNKYHHI